MPTLPRFERLSRPNGVRPSLWVRLRELLTPPASCAAQGALDFPEMVRRVYASGEEDLPAAPGLAELGHDLLAKENEAHVRRLGCVWLTMFPSEETVRAMRAIAIDPGEPLVLREQAAWTLGFRQLGTRHPSLFWAPDVVRAADAALLDALSSTRGEARAEAEEMLLACRHVAAPELLDAMADDVAGCARGIEAFATEKLARAALGRLGELPAPDAPRIIRLVGATLREEALPALLALAEATESIPDKVEALNVALSIDAERARPLSEAFLSTLVMPGDLRARADWHAAHPLAFPIVDALRVARTTAAIPPAERTPRARDACAGFASLAALAPFAETYLYAMWQKVVLLADDHAAVVACVEAHGKSLEKAPFLVRPYLEALAASGRFDRLARVATQHTSVEAAVWLLATHGRPFRALSMRGLATLDRVEACAGEALALFLAGRPDLAERACDDAKPLETGDEAWLLAHGIGSLRHELPALRAFRGGLPGLLAEIRGAPDDAEGDAVDMELLGRAERRLRRDLDGASVCLVGHFTDAVELRAELSAKGARIVSGPFAGTDFFVAAPDADTGTVARLTGMGARRLPYPFVKTA